MDSDTLFKGSVSANYDQYLGPLLFEPYAEYFSKSLEGLKVRNVLELACGTGRLTRHLLSLLDPNGVLHATDVNADMLAIARHKIQDPRIKWQLADAQELPFEDQTFDSVICQFGVMFFADKCKAFKEALRVLQPGCTFRFLTWDAVVHNIISYQTQLILQSVILEDPPAFHIKGPYSFFDKELIISTLEEVGFHDISVGTVPLIGSTNDLYTALTGILEGSPLASYLNERGIELDNVKEILKRDLTTYQIADAFHFPMQALYCIATR